jgi:hypothetical protein
MSPARQAAARLLIGLVFFFNVQCGLVFLILPQNYSDSFELSGIPGQVMVQALGLLFLMWNVPFAAALIQPIRNHNSLLQAIWMQAIGLAGETWMFFSLAAGHDLLRATAFRFILFDGAGLLALIASFWLFTTKREA